MQNISATNILIYAIGNHKCCNINRTVIATAIWMVCQAIHIEKKFILKRLLRNTFVMGNMVIESFWLTGRGGAMVFIQSPDIIQFPN